MVDTYTAQLITDATAIRIASALERIAVRLEEDAAVFGEMVQDGRTAVVLSRSEREQNNMAKKGKSHPPLKAMRMRKNPRKSHNANINSSAKLQTNKKY